MAERDRHDERRHRDHGPTRRRAATQERIAADVAHRARRRRLVRVAWAGALLALLAGGLALAITANGSVLRGALAIALLGVAGVLVVALAFLRVGMSEEEDRSRERRFGRAPGELEQRADRFRRDDRPPGA
jgi:hypothetical protein